MLRVRAAFSVGRQHSLSQVNTSWRGAASWQPSPPSTRSGKSPSNSKQQATNKGLMRRSCRWRSAAKVGALETELLPCGSISLVESTSSPLLTANLTLGNIFGRKSRTSMNGHPWRWVRWRRGPTTSFLWSSRVKLYGQSRTPIQESFLRSKCSLQVRGILHKQALSGDCG